MQHREHFKEKKMKFYTKFKPAIIEKKQYEPEQKKCDNFDDSYVPEIKERIEAFIKAGVKLDETRKAMYYTEDPDMEREFAEADDHIDTENAKKRLNKRIKEQIKEKEQTAGKKPDEKAEKTEVETLEKTE